jgi:hypothetical protein
MNAEAGWRLISVYKEGLFMLLLLNIWPSWEWRIWGIVLASFAREAAPALHSSENTATLFVSLPFTAH